MLNKYLKKIFIIIFSAILGIFILYTKSSAGSDIKEEFYAWKVLKTLHFNIYYSDRNIDFAVLCSKLAEENYVYVSNFMNHEINNAVNIIITDYRDNEKISRILNNKTGYNFCKYQDYYENYLFLSFNGNIHDTGKELTHKIVHCFQYEILFSESPWNLISNNSLSDFPDLLIETMAGYIASGYNEYDDIVMNDIFDSGSYSEIMDIYKCISLNGSLIPEAGKSFYYFLDRNYGRRKIGDILRNSVYLDPDESIETALNADINELNSEWIKFYKDRHSGFPGDNKRDGKQFSQPDNNRGKYFNLALWVINENNIYYLRVKDNVYEICNGDLSGNIKDVILKYESQNNITNLEDAVCSLNRPSVSVKSGKGVYLINIKSRGIMCIFDIGTGKITEEIKLPFTRIMDAGISADGENIAFVGVSNISSDIYIYNIKNKTIKRITSDLFSERYPEISSDNSFLVFCSNKNGNNPGKDEYILIRYDLNKNTQTVLVSDYNAIQPHISLDNKKILYSGNAKGIYNIFLYDIDTGKNILIINSVHGSLFPCWYSNSDEFLYSSFSNNTLNIYSASPDDTKIPFVNDKGIPEYTEVIYPASYFDPDDAVFAEYENDNNCIINTYGSGVIFENNYILNADMRVTDYLSFYELNVKSGLHIIKNENYFNANVEYTFLKYSIDPGFGFFYRSNPLFTCNSFHSDNNYCSLKPYYRDFSSKEAGLYFLINYPVFKNVFFGINAGSAKNNSADVLFEYSGDDRYSNLISASLAYDSVVLRNTIPVNGTKFEISFSNSFDITGNDFQYNVFNVYLLKTFNFLNKLFLTLNGDYGRISGRDSSGLAYYIGGVNTIRGHKLLKYNGCNAFFLQSEIRLVLIKRVLSDMILPLKLGNISFMSFFDIGSAWDRDYDLKKDNGEFNDLKAGTGIGLRFQVFDHMIFKLDSAWPYFYKSFGSNQILFAFNFNY